VTYKDVAHRGYQRFLGIRNQFRALLKGQSRSDYLNRLRSKGVRFKVVPVNDYRMKIDLNDNVITQDLFISGQWEPYESQLMANLLRPGMTFIDVGAHVGYYSLLAARAVGPTGQVIAFEPSPDNYALLTENIELNNLAHTIRAENVALDERSGERSLYLSTFNTGDHRIYSTLSDDDQMFNAGAQRNSVRVSVRSLDEYLSERNIGSVDMIKIDVQGAEMAVLSGMRKTLSSNPNIILFTEFWPHGLSRFGTNAQTLLSFLIEEVGFSLFHILPGVQRLERIEPLHFLSIAQDLDPLQQVDLLCCLNPALLENLKV